MKIVLFNDYHQRKEEEARQAEIARKEQERLEKERKEQEAREGSFLFIPKFVNNVNEFDNVNFNS